MEMNGTKMRNREQNRLLEGNVMRMMAILTGLRAMRASEEGDDDDRTRWVRAPTGRVPLLLL